MTALSLPLAAQEPILSPHEQLQIENLNLKAQLAQAGVQLAQAEAAIATCKLRLLAPEFASASADLVKEIEAAHPGYCFEPQSGAFTPKQPE